MIHRMQLQSETFYAMKAGYQSIALRLNDETCQRFRTGDEIEFTCIEQSEETLTKKIAVLHHFSDFEELFRKLPLLRCGESPFTLPQAKPEKMEAYYSREQQKKYGVLGIELEEEPLQRFLAGQTGAMLYCSGYPTALQEVLSGLKETHWIWYVFPQIRGLTQDTVTEYYALKNKQEAYDYLEHPVLGAELLEITQALLKLETCDPVTVFGRTDAFKFRSSMTLFDEIAPEKAVFHKALEKFCLGMKDEQTQHILSYDKS